MDGRRAPRGVQNPAYRPARPPQQPPNLRLPTFEADGMRLNKRLTLVARNGVIEHCFYPVFPPDRHSEEVIAWLRRQP